MEKQETEETQGSPGARSFVYNLNRFGYKVRSKPLTVHETVTPEGEKTVTHKGDWDMGIVVDMMRLADHADAYVLVSGDGDYVEAVDYLQSEKGLRVEAISATQCTSQALLDVCDLPHRPRRHTGTVPALGRTEGRRRGAASHRLTVSSPRKTRGLLGGSNYPGSRTPARYNGQAKLRADRRR